MTEYLKPEVYKSIIHLVGSPTKLTTSDRLLVLNCGERVSEPEEKFGDVTGSNMKSDALHLELARLLRSGRSPGLNWPPG